jgi:plasmid replication initiation protein
MNKDIFGLTAEMTLQKRIEKWSEKARARKEQDREKTKNKSVDDFRLLSNIWKTQKGNEQLNFCMPSIYRDNSRVMDVALFRLSKSQKRADEVIKYQISPSEYIEVKSGPDGIATVWDYDIVLIIISHLTEKMNRFHYGKVEKPSRIIIFNVSDILKFCRKGDGSRQYLEVEASLVRLQGTTIKRVRIVTFNGESFKREVMSERLIANFNIKSRTDTGKIAIVEIEAPDSIYLDITDNTKPNVLAFHPDYFLISSSIERFIYRLARLRAGKTFAIWRFSLIYERSGSKGSFKKFCFRLRGIIKKNDLPEFILELVVGVKGEFMLKIQRR